MKSWRDPSVDTTELAAQVGAAWEAIPDDVEADTLADAIAQIVNTLYDYRAVMRRVWDALPDDLPQELMAAQQVKLLVEQRDEARAQVLAVTASRGRCYVALQAVIEGTS